MRLFIAVDIPGPVRKVLASLQAKIGDAGKVKWVEEENLHVTMKFLGEVEEKKLEHIKKALGSVEHGAFTCQVRGFGSFPNDDYIKVIWAGAQPESEFKALNDKIENVLETLGFRKESRFHPHVTIGRVRFLRERELLKSKIKGLESEDFGEFPVNGFTLKKSTLTPEGPIYEDVAAFQLPTNKSQLR